MWKYPFYLFLILDLCIACAQVNSSNAMKEYQEDLIRLLDGKTYQVPDTLDFPPSIESDIQFWKSILSTEPLLPQDSVQLFLGLQNTPDYYQWQSITPALGEVQVTGMESPHHWLIKHKSEKGLREFLEQVLSPEARTALQLDTWQISQPTTRASHDFQWVYHPPQVALGALSDWKEASAVFTYKGFFYVVFYKVYAYGASPGFYPGLDWFPVEWRTDHNLRPRS